MKRQSTISKIDHDEIKLLRLLSGSVGDFIRYWGFRRIHGQIWCQIYLSKQELSGADLTKRLGVSKALVSPALSELEHYGLIESKRDGKKTKKYKANENFIQVVKDILKEREEKLINNANNQYEELLHFSQKKDANQSIVNSARLEDVGQMIILARFALDFLVGQSNIDFLFQPVKVTHRMKE